MSNTTLIHALSTAGDGAFGLTEHALADPGPGEVRVRVAAAGVNPAELMVRDGVMHLAGRISGTVGLGWDLAGTIEAVGPGVEAFDVGQPVIGIEDSFDSAVGAQAEALNLPLRAVAAAPEGVDLDAAATIGLNALTAKQSLDLLDLAPGARLLVTGALGAVGGFAAQLAALRGLEVVAVGRGDTLPSGVDGALDAATIGADALAAVRDGGVFVAVIKPAEPAAERGIRVTTVETHAVDGELAELSALAAEGKLTLRVAERFAFADAEAAYARVGAGGLRGRVVLTF
jgi:NADPH2:quinone reductase